MKSRVLVLFLTVTLVALAAAPKKKAAATKPVRTAAANPRVAGKATSKISGKASAAVLARAGKQRGKARVAVVRGPSYQTEPSPDRYREIQQALAAKGYLKTEPSGVWDNDSAEALKQFQTEHELSPTGKLSAASLIALGLGGGAQTASSAPPLSAPSSAAPASSPRDLPARTN